MSGKGEAYRTYRKRELALIRKLVLAVASICIITVLTVMVSAIKSKAVSETADPDSCKYYTSIEISKGDSIWSLASEYIDSHYESKEAYIDEVIQINSLSDADDIVAGEYIIMPYYSSESK